jgi:hypothetical protein
MSRTIASGMVSSADRFDLLHAFGALTRLLRHSAFRAVEDPPPTRFRQADGNGVS